MTGNLSVWSLFLDAETERKTSAEAELRPLLRSVKRAP
jgi:hypothetical protein